MKQKKFRDEVVKLVTEERLSQTDTIWRLPLYMSVCEKDYKIYLRFAINRSACGQNLESTRVLGRVDM